LVLIVDEENAELLLRKRLQMLLAGRGISPDVPVKFLIGNAVDLSPARTRSGAASSTGTYRRLLETVRRLRPALVIFDSLTRVHRANENSAREMAEVFKEVKRLVDKSGAACLFNHHFRKSGTGGGGGGQRIRGSSDIRAFCDYTLLVDESADGATLTHDKSRWSEPIAPFSAKFISDDSSFRTEYSGDTPTSAGKADKFRETWQAIVNQFESNNGRLSRQHFVKQVVQEQKVCSERTLDRVLGWRSEKEFLVKSRDGKEVLYSLVDDGNQRAAIEVSDEPFDLEALLQEMNIE
jgi:hypothetical protein